MRDGPGVAVIGAGIGGLALAQGLRRAGIRVTVYERDPGRAVRRQGYRIHIGPAGAAALRSCVPPELYRLFRATSGHAGDRITVLTSQLRELRAFPVQPAPGEDSGPVDRLTLREILLGGLDDVVCFGRELRRYEQRGDRVRLHFASGDPAEAEVLVGADGIDSAVRRQLLPGATVADTGTRLIYGKTALTTEVRDILPEALGHGFVAVTSLLRPVGMALGLMEFPEPPARAAARLQPGLAVRDCDSYVMWALSAQARALPPDLTELSAARLGELAERMTGRWHRRLRALVASADREQTFGLAVRISTPTSPWPGSRVTVLGDAVHAMSPAGGSGANTALRDAALLAARLAAQPCDPVAAITSYQPEMLDYGFAAVRESQRANARFRRRA